MIENLNNNSDCKYMSANPFARDLRKLFDPLREETRKARKALLVWCLASLAITMGDLFPTEISALGMKVSPSNRDVILNLIFLVIGYHVITFFYYGASDFLHWYVNQKSTEWEDEVVNLESTKAEIFAKSKLAEEDKLFLEEQERRLGAIWRSEPLPIYKKVETAIPYVSILRAIIDFFLPIGIGITSLSYLFLKNG